MLRKSLGRDSQQNDFITKLIQINLAIDDINEGNPLNVGFLPAVIDQHAVIFFSGDSQMSQRNSVTAELYIG